MNKEPTAQSELALILKDTVLPQIKRDGMANIFTACPQWRPDMDLPEGMTATRKPLRGKRVPVRGGRPYGKMALGEAIWPEDGLHSSRTPKLCFILTGPVAFHANNYLLHCGPGHGILLPAGTPFSNGRHSFLDQDRQHRGIYEMLSMMPYQGGLVCWLSRGQQDAQGKMHRMDINCMISHSQVPFYLSQLLDEATTNNLQRDLVCNGLLNVAIGLLHRELQQSPVLQTGEIPATVRNSVPKKYSIAQAQAYIESHLREPLSIDRVTRFACMSRSVFTAQFRAKTGKTFSQYIQDLRFEEACKLLRETDLAVGQISAAVGLKPPWMRVLFRERKNMSPLEFREGTGEK